MTIGEEVNADNLEELMIKDRRTWNEITRALVKIMSTKEREERDFQAMARI